MSVLIKIFLKRVNCRRDYRAVQCIPYDKYIVRINPASISRVTQWFIQLLRMFASMSTTRIGLFLFKYIAVNISQVATILWHI